jgi:dTMP kinase
VPGLFLSLEGIEGSGKTTQAALLEQGLLRVGIPVVRTREPGGTDLAEQIRTLILDVRQEAVHRETELLLFLAARAQHVRERIGPALEAGQVVICDRFTDATLAYQGGGRWVDPSILNALNGWASGGVQPRRTYLLDVPVTVGMARAKNRGGEAGIDRIEREGSVFLEAVRDEYLRLAEREPARILVLNGLEPPEMLAKVILTDVESMRTGRQPPTTQGTPS